MSLALGAYALSFSQVGLGVFSVGFAMGSIFIYDGARDPSAPRLVSEMVQTSPQSPWTQLVRVTYAPTTELVVHEVIERDQTEFFEDVIRDSLAYPIHLEPTVNWVDGLALLTTQLPPASAFGGNPTGRIHYQAVTFTRISYHNKINMKLGGQTYSVRLRKAENNPNLVALAIFLKRFHTGTTSRLELSADLTAT